MLSAATFSVLLALLPLPIIVSWIGLWSLSVACVLLVCFWWTSVLWACVLVCVCVRFFFRVSLGPVSHLLACFSVFVAVAGHHENWFLGSS